MASEDLEQSLRAEVDGYIGGRLDGLREEIVRLQSQLNEALTRFAERLESETQSNQSITVAISEHLRGARNEGIETAASEASRARGSSDVAIIKAAVDDISERRTQADVLNALVNRAASFAPRVAFFVVKNDNATGWRARGLEGTIGDDAVRELSLPLASDTLLGAAAKSRATWSGAPDAHADDQMIFSHFGGDSPPQRVVAVPLIARGKAVAVLYADCAEMDSDAINLEALETIVRVSGMAVELLAAGRPAAESAAPHEATNAAPAGTAADLTPGASWEGADPTIVEPYGGGAAPSGEANALIDDPPPRKD